MKKNTNQSRLGGIMNFHRKLLSACTVLSLCAAPGLVHAAAVSGQGTWETTLQARYFDNDATVDGYYDTVLGITWLADANYAKTSGFDADGLMNWPTANAWAAGLDFNGITGWRLPITNPVDGTTADDDSTYAYNGTEDRGYNVSAPGTLYAGSTASEMAHMYYNTLGNKGHCDPATSTVSACGVQSGWGLTNTADFRNVKGYTYWSATKYANNIHTSPDQRWLFDFGYGLQYSNREPNAFFAWAVHSGDVGATSPVPVPAAVWLFGSGLLGLFGLDRPRRR